MWVPVSELDRFVDACCFRSITLDSQRGDDLESAIHSLGAIGVFDRDVELARGASRNNSRIPAEGCELDEEQRKEEPDDTQVVLIWSTELVHRMKTDRMCLQLSTSRDP